jgi:DNA-binding LytR/AlgR family response regulator
MAKPIQILIFEDEESAARSLQKALGKLIPSGEFEVVAVLETLRESRAFFEKHPDPDLIFMDIQLSDGLSFELFDFYRPSCPIIFTTAYSEYAIKAFEHNGLHYLLKPIQDKDLKSALQRFEQNRKVEHPEPALKDLLKHFRPTPSKEHFLVYAGESMRLIPTEEIALFAVKEKAVWLYTLKGEQFRLSQRLEEIQSELAAQAFYRANRQMLIHKKAIVKIDLYFNQKLLVQVKPDPKLQVIISKEKASDFKAWLEG